MAQRNKLNEALTCYLDQFIVDFEFLVRLVDK